VTKNCVKFGLLQFLCHVKVIRRPCISAGVNSAHNSFLAHTLVIHKYTYEFKLD